jgi:hypothetical protein
MTKIEKLKQENEALKSKPEPITENWVYTLLSQGLTDKIIADCINAHFGLGEK